MSDYSGWSNYPTGAVTLWHVNSQSGWHERAQEIYDAMVKDYPDEADIKQRIKDTEASLAEEMEVDYDMRSPMNDLPNSMYSDIYQWASQQIDWREIAERYTDDVEMFTMDRPND
jgi:hypothetical protein